MALGALLGAGASLLGGLLSSKGTKAANAQQIALAREQMDFQERMSNTAYQRAADDLQKAGLNRILAIGSPASSPGGAMPNIQNELQGIASGVSAAAHSAADLRNKGKQGKLIDAQAYQAENAGVAADSQAMLNNQQWELLQEQTQAAAQDVRIKKVEAELAEDWAEIQRGLGTGKVGIEILKTIFGGRK